MTLLGPNLAARPFANERPVRRTTVLIWMIAILLLAVNVLLYQRHLSGQGEQSRALSSLEQRIEAEETTVRRLEAKLSGMDIDDQNEVIGFLNGEIAKRTFSWSHFFDQLEEVLPPDVEVRRVSPRVLDGRGRRGGTAASALPDVVSIELSGSASDDDQLLTLVDNFFAHSSFVAPDLMSETQRDEHLEFAMTVLYLPQAEGSDPAAGEDSRVEEATLLDTGEGVEP